MSLVRTVMLVLNVTPLDERHELGKVGSGSNHERISRGNFNHNHSLNRGR